MNKYWWLILAVVLLFLAGTGYYLYKHRTRPETTSMQTVSPTPSGVFASIQEALSKSLTLQCTFTDDMNHKTNAYIKAGAVRVDVVGTNPNQPYNAVSTIMKNQKIYSWDPAKKQGMVMTFAMPTGMMTTSVPVTGMPSTSPNQTSPNGTNFINMLEKFKESCKTAVVADSMFVPPTDVTFQDLSKIMPSGMPTQQSHPTSSY